MEGLTKEHHLLRNVIRCDKICIFQSVHISENKGNATETVSKKRSDLCKKGSIVLHQDNAPVHNALPVEKFSANKRIPVLEYDL